MELAEDLSGKPPNLHPSRNISTGKRNTGLSGWAVPTGRSLPRSQSRCGQPLRRAPGEKRGAYVFRWDETPLAALRDRIEAMSRTWTVNYLVLRSDSAPHYLEVKYGYGFEPKKVGAPASLVFPWPSYCGPRSF